MMALIETMERRDIQRPSRHGEVAATYSVLQIDDETYLQIDTYGAADRQIPGKISQSVQFGPAGVAELRRLLALME